MTSLKVILYYYWSILFQLTVKIRVTFKSKNNAITSYFGEANSLTIISAAIYSTAAEIYWALKCT